jgi:hypothetical protein
MDYARFPLLSAMLLPSRPYNESSRSASYCRYAVKNAKTHSDEKIIVGQPINLLGEKIGDNIFQVDEIVPVKAGRGFLRRFNGPANGQKMPMMPNINNMPAPEESPVIIIEDTSSMPF